MLRQGVGRNMHTRLTILMISAVMVTGVLFGGTAEAQTTGAQTTGDYTTVWNGIYTPDQALRGQDAFELHCLRCHETDIDAANPDARFRGHMFMERWREYDLVSLYDFIRLTMPRRDPGSLSDATYVDIVAHVMMVNAFPPGPRELDTEVLQSIPPQELCSRHGRKVIERTVSETLSRSNTIVPLRAGSSSASRV